MYEQNRRTSPSGTLCGEYFAKFVGTVEGTSAAGKYIHERSSSNSVS